MSKAKEYIDEWADDEGYTILVTAAKEAIDMERAETLKEVREEVTKKAQELRDWIEKVKFKSHPLGFRDSVSYTNAEQIIEELEEVILRQNPPPIQGRPDS